MSSDKLRPFLLFTALYCLCLFDAARSNSQKPLTIITNYPRTDSNNNQPIVSPNTKRLDEQKNNIFLTSEELISNHEDSKNQQKHLSQSSSQIQYRKSVSTSRLLVQQNSTSNKFLIICSLLFRALFTVTRNLIIVGIFTNSIDVFLPFIILSESLLMVGFWTCQKHYLTNFYTDVFGSYWDIFNCIRLITQPGTSGYNLPQLSQYGFSPILLVNIMGEFLVAAILLVFTILSKVSTICLKYQKLRKLASNLNSIWNAFFLAILPRVATFTGIHWRLIGVGANYDVTNGIFCGITTALMVFFFIFLIAQIKKITQKTSGAQLGIKQLGVVTRIIHNKRFEFDCLRYSSLYYPVMNYVRLLIYYIPIGASWDFYYASYGGAITGQLLMMMIEVSSTGYILRRDRILFPLQNFLLVIMHLCIITIGLAESVQHSQVSEIAQTILFCIMIFVYGSSFIGLCLDSWRQINTRCQKKEQDELEKQMPTTYPLANRSGKSGTMSSVKKSEGSEEESEASKQDSHQNVIKSTVTIKKTMPKVTKNNKVLKGTKFI